MKRQAIPAAVGVLMCCVAIIGVDAQPYPLLDKVVRIVIQRYETSSCQQIAVQRATPPDDMQKRAVDMMRKDPQLRKAFLDQVAGPIVNKLFDCGMIP